MKNNNKKISKKNKEFYIQEYLKCKENFEYFCRNYVIIENVGGDVKFCPYSKQIEFIKLVEENHHVIVCKSRQIGLSTISQIYLCYLLTFYRNFIVGIISKDGPEATNFTRKIASFIDKLPSWMKVQYTKRNEQMFQLKNGSKCFCSPINPNFPSRVHRGKSLTMLVADEVSFCSKMDEAWGSLIPALSINQQIAKNNEIPYGTILISTPNGVSGVGRWFYERYMSAKSRDDIFVPFECHYSDIPEISGDPEWLETQKKLFASEKAFRQELEMEFISSEGSFFPEDTISILQQNTKNLEPMTINKVSNGEAWEFKPPQEGHQYLIGVDTAPENGKDKSAVVVLDYESLEQVYEYKCKTEVRQFIKMVKNICYNYRGCLVIENNSYGNQVMEEMKYSDFSYMVYKPRASQTYGLSNNPHTRPLIIDALYTYVTQFPEIIKSKRLALELIGMEYKQNGKVEASVGGHDDLAMALAFCCYVRKYDPPMFINMKGEEGSNFINILNMNDENKFKKINDNFSIKKHVKENLNDLDPYIDIFKIMNG